MRVIGIDPGVTGGIVLNEDGKPIMLTVMPVIKITKKSTRNGKAKEVNSNEYLDAKIAQIIKSCAPDHIVIEKQQAFPQQGAVSMFSVGIGYGILRGICAGLGYPIVVITTQSWQNALFKGMPRAAHAGAGGRSKASTANAAVLCSRLWPTVSFQMSERSKAYHEGLADAACIAEFGYRMFSGNENREELVAAGEVEEISSPENISSSPEIEARRVRNAQLASGTPT